MLLLSHIYVWYQKAREKNAWGLNPSSFDDHQRGCHLKVIKRNHRKYIDVDDLKKSFETDSRKKHWNGKEDDSEIRKWWRWGLWWSEKVQTNLNVICEVHKHERQIYSGEVIEVIKILKYPFLFWCYFLVSMLQGVLSHRSFNINWFTGLSLAIYL